MRRKYVIGGGISAFVVVCVVGCLLAFQAWRAQSQIDGATYHELEHDDRTRSFWVYEPDTLAADTTYPLVIVLHGGTGNAANANRMSGMMQVADEAGFIVIYPNGTGGLFDDRILTWNAGNCCGYGDDNNIDDVGFISAVIDLAIAEYNVNPDAVFVTGMSNGGMMSHRIGCELSEKVTGIAPVAGALNTECNPADPVGVFIIHGTDDAAVLYDGGEPDFSLAGPRTDTSAPDSTAAWAEFNGCAGDPVRSDYNDDVYLLAYEDCTGSPVVLVTIEGGGHSWPGGTGSRLVDPVYEDYDASAEMWAFFAGLIPSP